MIRGRRLQLAVAVCAALAAASPNPLHDAERFALAIATHGSAQDPTGTAPPRTAYGRDVRRVARVFSELALPLPEWITLELYPSSEFLAAAIAERGAVAPDLATMLGRFAAGIAVEDTLLMLEAEFRRGPRPWLRLLAHEMTHLSQIELGGTHCGPRWMVEGMADWVAFTVLDRLGVTRMSVEREAIVLQARRDIARGLRVDLDRMERARDFLRHTGSTGVASGYRLAFLLADHLIERHSLAAVVEYFRTCDAPADRRVRFEQRFGHGLADFQREVAQALQVP